MTRRLRSFKRSLVCRTANSQIKELARAALAEFQLSSTGKKLPEPPITAHSKPEPKTKPKPALDSLDSDNALLQATGGIPESAAGLGATGNAKSERGTSASGSQNSGRSLRAHPAVQTRLAMLRNPANIEAQCAEIQCGTARKSESRK